MEQVALNNVKLDYLARKDEALKPYFHGTVACDRLPKKPSRNPCGYIVNTDPQMLSAPFQFHTPSSILVGGPSGSTRICSRHCPRPFITVTVRGKMDSSA